ncbi:MAG: VOC family protein [Thermoanaerobaculia bacterium]
MRLAHHLTFAGDCEEAFEVYSRILGGTLIGIRKYADTPLGAQMPTDWQQKIIFASLKVGDEVLHGTDHPPNQYRRPEGFYLSLHIREPEDAARIFHSLSNGGAVQVSLQKSFWSTHFALFVDRFGIPWEIDHEAPP